MIKTLNHKLVVLLLLLFFSCGKSLPTLNNIDLKEWLQDKNACNGKRTAMASAIDEQKEKLLGLSENQIVDLLGRPDHNELYKRNQKFYYYFLEPGTSCTNYNERTSKQLVVRFNAMGIAKEVSVEL
jgi:outer membrane protein assembly factor BamE (lipoprotein component of BamABCDE complex)